MLIDPAKTYTYKDYLAYDEGEIIEIIDGQIYNMSPAPSRIHQEIISALVIDIGNYIKSNNGSCKVYPAPFDVIIKNEDEDIINSKNIVQPDISVICVSLSKFFLLFMLSFSGLDILKLVTNSYSISNNKL